MNSNTYDISWNWIGSIEIRNNTTQEKLRLKKKYHLKCYLYSFIGIIPVLLIESFPLTETGYLDSILSLIILIATHYLILYLFYRFLKNKNRNEDIVDYIEEQD